MDEFTPHLAPAARMAAWVGRSQRRREDAALLRGEGRFVNDIVLPGCLSVAFVRASAIGAIGGIDTSVARGQPGVCCVVVAADLQCQGQAAVNPLVDDLVAAPLEVLAGDVAWAVGQPVAAVVARTQRAAELAADCVTVAIGPGAPQPAGCFAQSWSDTGEPRVNDAVRVSVRIQHARVAAMPMEPRATLAAWDDAAGQLTVWLPTQSPHRGRADLARVLGLPVSCIRVIAPDVGGAFGSKASIFPEDILVAWAAWRLKTAVHWQGSRAEDLLAGTHGRGLLTEGSLDVAADGRMLALHARVQAPLGHWMPYSAVVPGRNAGRILPGPYEVPCVDVAVAGSAGGTAAMGIYRGAGRPEAAMLMERLADLAARRLRIDPLALRRRNLVPAAAMPSLRPTGETLDSGDFVGLLDRAAALSGYDALRARQAVRRHSGALVGIGVGFYVEPCGQGWESAGLALQPDGSFIAATGSTTQGQGRETAFAQILADALHCAPDRIAVRHGDTALTPPGIGALASRSTGIGGGALVRAAEAMVARARPIAAQLLGCPTDAPILTDAGFVAPLPFLSPVSWRDIATQDGALLCVSETFEAPGEAWSSGCCIAALVIDPDTMVPTIEHITLVDDAGTIVNPLLLEGQLMGGLAQGLGEALYERIVYDADGQLLTGSLMDYALPRASDMPEVRLASLPCPTPVNPLGAKGVGEAGCIGVPAALVNAAVDALAPLGVEHLDMPLTPDSLWHAVRQAQSATRG